MSKHTSWSAKFAKDDGDGDKAEGKNKVSPHPVANFYWVVSWILGFNEKYSLALLVFFGGALIGICLARAFMMDPANVKNKTVSGEWFWYSQRLYKPCIFIHIYCSIFSGIGAVFQFIPAIRRRAVILHRINGYLVLGLLILSTVGGSIVARRAFGGELNVQSAFYVDGLLIVFCAFMGFRNVKQTRKHRKWMLRMVSLAAIPVTARLTSIAARHIISDVGSYYATWRCDQVVYVEPNQTVLSELGLGACTGSNLSSTYVAIRGATTGNGLAYASSVRITWGMALWIALILHMIGVEIYIQQTDASNMYRRGFVLQRNEEEIMPLE